MIVTKQLLPAPFELAREEIPPYVWDTLKGSRKYSGSKDVEKLDTWIESALMNGSSARVSEYATLVLAYETATGDARHWVCMWTYKWMGEARSDLYLLRQFVRAARVHFVPDYYDRMMDVLTTLNQKGSILEHNHAFTKAWKYLCDGSGDFPETFMRHRYMRSLKSSLRRQVEQLVPENTSWVDLMKIAVEVSGEGGFISFKGI